MLRKSLEYSLYRITFVRDDNSGSAVVVHRPRDKYEGESVEDPDGGSHLE